MDYLKWLFYLSLFMIIGCFCSNSDESVDFTIKVIDESEIFIDFENEPGIVFPAFIRTASNYFLIYDGGEQKIVKFNYEGEQILSFGKEGKGPGELQSLTNYWIMKDHYLLYDYNGAKMVRYDLTGSFIDEYQVNIGELTMVVDALSTNTFVHPANGKEGALLRISDVKNDMEVYFGDAIAGEHESSNEESRDIIRRGGVPNYMKNSVMLGSNNSGIFSFQNARAVLQKFSAEGELFWERDLNVPTVDGVYEHFRKINREFIYPLTYARGMYVTENGVAILLNTTEEKSTTIAWLNNDGKDICLIEFPNIVLPSSFAFRFGIAPDQDTIFFIDSIKGKVIKSIWPIE